MRNFIPVISTLIVLLLNGCASYSQAVIAKPHNEVASKLQRHFTSGYPGVFNEIYDLEQTLNRKVARFHFLEDRRKAGGINTQVFALPIEGGKTRILVRTVDIKPKLPGWSETIRKPDLEARWLDRIKELFAPDAR